MICRFWFIRSDAEYKNRVSHNRPMAWDGVAMLWIVFQSNINGVNHGVSLLSTEQGFWVSFTPLTTCI